MPGIDPPIRSEVFDAASFPGTAEYTFPAATTQTVHWHVSPSGIATWSVSCTHDQQAQAITFTSTPPSPAAVGVTYTPTATGGGAGNPVTFGASGACSASGGVVNLNSVGTCTVTADQAGNAGYLAAPQAQQVFSVSAGYAVSNLSPPAKTKAQAGSAVPVKFSLTVGGTPVSNTQGAQIAAACGATVQLDGLTALCATYDASSRLFRANVKSTKTLLGSVPITITVKIGTTTVATKTVNITIVK